MFVDKVTVSVHAGDGGDGCVSFRKEKYIDKGGPDGGDGGRGANVVVVASYDQNTLSRFRYDKTIQAEGGNPGTKRRKAGRGAKDLLVKVPVGTVVSDETGAIRADLTYDGQEVVIAKGGKGGFGNAHFTSSVRQAPKFAEKGEPGESYDALFELKMIADVGIVGLPNAGKSTLLAATTNAKPDIANYPFTTITPNLGVVDLDSSSSMLLADIPGLIEGASAGKGLGDDFLRHIERTNVLIHCIDSYSDDVVRDYNVIREELSKYSDELSKKQEVVFLTKIEGLDKDITTMQKDLLVTAGVTADIFAVSAQSGEGLKQALWAVFGVVDTFRKQKAIEEQADPTPRITPDFGEDAWSIEQLDEITFAVIGRKIEKFAIKTDFSNDEGKRRLRSILAKKGVMHELRRAGAKPGDKIVFGKLLRDYLEL